MQAENEVYQKDKLLGQGAFGKAYLVRQKQTGECLVIKEVNIDHMSQKQREETIKEAQILRNFRHPLIVRFVEVYATKQNKLKIVMEYAQCGDLSKAIHAKKASKKYFDESQILDWFTQICLAMKHVHDRKILHRDIKGQNIFITKANTLKLGDFGIARVLNKTQDKARTVVGTPYYLSPQIIENKPYSFKSDVWSMGVLLYELCVLAPPFTATSLQFLALKIVKGSYSNISGSYSQQLKSLVAELLQLDPNRRPSVGDILKKPFLQDRIRKYLSETYRKDEFSHTILHNQKFQIANKLVKIQGQQQAQKTPQALESERNKLKQEALMLKGQMYRKKQEQQEKIRRKEEYKRKQDQNKKRSVEQQKKRDEEHQKRIEYQQRQKEVVQRRAIEQRKQWVQREKRKQLESQQREDEMRRVQDIAQMGRRRQREQMGLIDRKERLIQDKYQIQREREQYAQKQKEKQRNAKNEENKKMDQLNDFARKQWYENQIIRKRAEERARQAEMDSYNEVEPTYEQPKYEVHRPQSNQDGRRNSRDKDSGYGKAPHKINSMPQNNPKEEQLQNAMLNPNFNKKTPQSARSKQKDSNKSTNASNVSNWRSNSREDKKKQDSMPAGKKNYEQDRDRIKRDRQQFMKKKGASIPMSEKQPQKTLKPAKWGNKERSKSRQQEQQPKKVQSVEETEDYGESIMQSNDLHLDIKDQNEFNDYLNELEGLLGNVNKNIEKMQNPSPQILPEMEIVEEKIVLREDDSEELDYSMTGGFSGIRPKPQEINADDADLDYFSSYQKLQSLRICLQDKFGTDNFITIYRAIEQELQEKSLEGFNILQVIKNLGNVPNANLISNNLPLLLTLVVMEERMSCA